jgi:hypothetical protein
MRSCKSKKDRQYNDQKKQKHTDLQNTKQITKNWATKKPTKTGGEIFEYRKNTHHNINTKRANLIGNTNCLGGNVFENAEHYFLYCNIFSVMHFVMLYVK